MTARRRGSPAASAAAAADMPSCADLARLLPALHTSGEQLESAAVVLEKGDPQRRGLGRLVDATWGRSHRVEDLILATPPRDLANCAALAMIVSARLETVDGDATQDLLVERIQRALRSISAVTAAAASLEPASIKFAAYAPGFDHAALVEGDACNLTERRMNS